MNNPVYAGAYAYGYYCANREAVNGRDHWCMRVGAMTIDQAVAEAFLAAIAPAGLEAAIEAVSFQLPGCRQASGEF